VFLFDEPLSNLDAALRGQTRVEIANLHRQLGATTIYVTHDQVEAMTLADRVVVLRDGQIEQVGTPLELYDSPANQFVAQFIGTPRMNVMPRDAAGALISTLKVPVDAQGFIGMRPESVTVVTAGQGQLQGKIEIIEALGAETLIYLRTSQGAQLVARQTARTPLSVGDEVGVQVDIRQVHVFSDTGRVQSSPAGAADSRV
jgi:multiple sugar transport system ATP-binding protein